MEKINFENGQLVTPGYVEIDGTQHEVHEAEYEGDTPLSAHTLNLMQTNIEQEINNSSIVVSPTEPQTNRKKVWMQKGKNLFDKDNLFSQYRLGSDGLLFADNDYSATNFIKIKPNTKYITNWILETRECICYYDKTKTFISRNVATNPFTTPQNCEYIRASRLSTNIANAQIEQNTTATSYEAYVEPKIYVLNNNNVYEEFIKNDIKTKTNDNKTVTKFPDGTMIFRTTISKESFLASSSNVTTVQNIKIYRSGMTSISFPSQFASSDVQASISIESGTNGSRFYQPRINWIGNTGIQLQLLSLEDFIENAVGYTNLSKVHVTVIGRWK